VCFGGYGTVLGYDLFGGRLSEGGRIAEIRELDGVF